jgi:succinylglutamate desuccinylase
MMTARSSPAAATAIHQELSAVVGNAAGVERLEASGAFRIRSEAAGPSVVILGSIHGDEPSGYAAIKSLLAEFAAGRLQLERGSLTLVVGNELALERRVRKVEQDLNRLFKAEANPEPNGYEEHRAEVLKQLLSRAAYMMDLHATSQPTLPFLMCESHVLPEACEMGFPRIVIGWRELGNESLGGDTESYLNSIHGKGFTVEAGQRDSPDSAPAAVDAARRLLRHLRMVPYETPAEPKPLIYKFFASIDVDERTFSYHRKFHSFARLQAGELIGQERSQEHRAPRDCVLVMPSKKQFMLAEQQSG